jgi:hypothetical protein
MNKKLKYSSKFSLRGYTINPIKDSAWLSQMISGLFTYSKEHLCDYGHESYHKNYLGNPIGKPYIVNIQDSGNMGLIATQYMSNGYLVMKIIDDTYPAEVRFDLFLNESLDDVELLIDHLTSPAIPFDGPGIFDYTYSLVHENTPVHHLNKSNRSKASYFINDPLKINEEDGSWSATLNELGKIECYFCEKRACRWIIVGAPYQRTEEGQMIDINLAEFRSVPSCEYHLHKGRFRERNTEKEKDYWTSKENIYRLDHIENKNSGYSVNKPVNE